MWGEGYGVSAGSPGAGVGRKRLCETCGDEGRGAWREREHRMTAGGGLTGTEAASLQPGE